MNAETITESQMHTIEDAVRLLSKHGLLEIVSGDRVFPAINQQVGPLTTARNKKTGEFVFLLADSTISVSLKDLTFQMTIGKSESKRAAAGN